MPSVRETDGVLYVQLPKAQLVEMDELRALVQGTAGKEGVSRREIVYDALRSYLPRLRKQLKANGKKV